MNSLLFLYFLVELTFIFLLNRKYKTPNVIVLGYFLFFIYAQSTYINYLTTGVDYIHFNSFNSLNFSLRSNAFFMASTYYFLFMFTYGMLGLFMKNISINESKKSFAFVKLNFKLKLLIVFFVLFFINYHLQTLGMDRVQKKQFSFLPFDFIIFYMAYYLWAFLLFYSKKKTLFFYFLTFVILYHSVFSFEREYIVLIGLILLFKFKNYFKGNRFLIIASIGFLVLTYWKKFYLHVIIGSDPFLLFLSELKFDLQLSTTDSVVGMSLLTEYFENDIYQDYYISYVSNTYNQFVRIFFNTGYKSLAEYTTHYYTQGNMGTAFSMVLESILNFGVLGPILLPFFIIKVFIKTLRNKFFLYDFYSIFLVFMMIKLVRTELTVLIKLYIMPFIIFVLLMRYFYKKEIFKIF